MAMMAVLVHGGAGTYARDREPYEAGCRAAVERAWHLLARGGSALDAAEAAVAVLEDDPLFNAGTGSVLNRDGIVEMDAAIMDGSDLRAGACGAVRRVRNPVTLARCILEHGPHVLLVGDGAERFARERGVEMRDPAELITPERRRQWAERRTTAQGTVGAVALDARGYLAAATSTGGLFDKHPGRVGDTPIIGAGTYADTRGAISCTGDGDAIMRAVLARRTAEWLADGHLPMQAAARAITFLAAHTSAQAGVIVINRAGRLGYVRNTAHMPIAYMRSDMNAPVSGS